MFQFAHKDDTAKRLHLGGRTGAKVKELVCKLTVKQLVNEARKPGSHTWAKGEQGRRLLRAQRRETAATAEQSA
jgi:hypothetical protein